MKTTIRTIILAAASIFAAMSCQKEGTAPAIKVGEPIQVSVNASLVDFDSVDDTKATIESVARLRWAAGDKVQAYCGTEKISTGDGLTVTPSDNGLFASLTGEITAPEAGKTITFVYSNGCAADGLTFDFSSQEKSSLPFVAYGTLKYDGSAIAGKMVEFKFATSVMKIAASNLAGGTINSVTVSGINTKVTLAPSESGVPEITGGTSGTVATTNYSAASDGTRAIITVGLVPDNTSSPKRKIAVTQACKQTAALTSSAIAGNKSYTTLAVLEEFVLPEGALSGEFSVSATKAVHFSRGNLVATINASGSPTAWRFATNQHDCLGEGGANKTIGKTAGDVDLFGWSTASTKYGISTSYDNSDYSGDFVDWGKAIGDGSTWRTLSKDEWKYLINKDNDENIRKGKYKYGVTVCGKTNCLILAPDDYAGTIAASYDAATWSAAEAAGLVCLPAAGYRYGSNVSDVGVSGICWSSSADVENYAYLVLFYSGYVSPDDGSDRSYGYSVRLVTESD